jgi:hypothetical protein
MHGRDEAVAKNEAADRELNKQIEESYESHPADSYMDIVCECAMTDCDVFLKVMKAEYEDVRADARQFMVVRDHVDPDVEDVVRETDRFTVVAKREGEPAEIARQTDPPD